METSPGGFHFVVTHRGAELERIKDLTVEEALFLLLECVTLDLAANHELADRKEVTDGRRVWFPHQERLMGALNPAWGRKLEEKHREILKRPPFQAPSVDAQYSPRKDTTPTTPPRLFY